MASKVPRYLAALLLGCLLASEAAACRYTIRDAGFVDIGAPPYRLYLYADSVKGTAPPSALKLAALLSDTNVSAQVVDVGADRDHPALRYLEALKIAGAPAAVLVSPENRARSLLEEGRPFPERIGTLVEAVTASPARAVLLRNAEALCTVLFVPGREGKRNPAARGEVTRAIDRVRGMLGAMAKPMQHPPVLVELAPEDLEREQILLWSLGIGEEDLDEPSVVVLYGKGQRMGPLLRGERISEQAVLTIFRIIGADCECGIDRIWLNGTRIPLRWEEAVKERIVKHLGFDPENPMVRLEVSQIVGRGPYGGARAPRMMDLYEDDLLLGYSEEVVAFDPPGGEGGAPAGDGAPPFAGGPPSRFESPGPATDRDRPEGAAAPGREPPDPGEGPSPARTVLMTLIGLIVVMLAASLWIMRRSRKN